MRAEEMYAVRGWLERALCVCVYWCWCECVRAHTAPTRIAHAHAAVLTPGQGPGQCMGICARHTPPFALAVAGTVESLHGWDCMTRDGRPAAACATAP